MSTSRAPNEPILSPLSVQILLLKNAPGKHNIISPLNLRNGCRKLAPPLPTDPTRSFDYPPYIPQNLNSIWTLNFIGFTQPTSERIWKHFDLISGLPLPPTTSTTSPFVRQQERVGEGRGGSGNQEEEHDLLHVAKIFVRTRAEMSVDFNCSVNEAMESMGLGRELSDAVMNFAMDQLKGVKGGAEGMLKDTANLQDWTVAVIEKRWFSLVNLDRVIIEQQEEEDYF